MEDDWSQLLDFQLQVDAVSPTEQHSFMSSSHNYNTHEKKMENKHTKKAMLYGVSAPEGRGGGAKGKPFTNF